MTILLEEYILTIIIAHGLRENLCKKALSEDKIEKTQLLRGYLLKHL